MQQRISALSPHAKAAMLQEVQPSHAWESATILGACPHCGEVEAMNSASDAGEWRSALTTDRGVIYIFSCTCCGGEFRSR